MVFVCVHASVNSPLFQTRLVMVACLFTSISLGPKWLRHGSDGDPTPRAVGFRLFSGFNVGPQLPVSREGRATCGVFGASFCSAS